MKNQDGLRLRATPTVGEIDRIIVEQIDPENLVAGGTDTCIHDLIKYNTGKPLGIVGVTGSKDRPIGRWQTVTVAGKEVPFMPVIRLDRRRTSGWMGHIPHSLLVAMGVIRFRSRIARGTLQAHRVEMGALLARLKPRRLVQFIHNDAAGLTGVNSDSLWKRAPGLYHRLERTVFSQANCVVLFNISDSARVSSQFPSVEVARTWFDPETFTFADRARWNSSMTLKVCFVGRLETQKDPKLALDAFATLLGLHPDSHLLVLGDGSLKGKLAEHARALRISRKVEFAGMVTRSEVARTMSESTVLLLSSHYEGSPRVLVEAGAVGLPVAATAGADPDRALDAERNGVRTSSREPAELAAAILSAASLDPAECRKAAESFAADVVVNRLLTL